jgi:hypothetical protein
MRAQCTSPGDLILLYHPSRILCTKSSRKRARKHRCDGFRYLCAICAGPHWWGKRAVSHELMENLALDADFTLLHALTWASARAWTRVTRFETRNAATPADISVLQGDRENNYQCFV